MKKILLALLLFTVATLPISLGGNRPLAWSVYAIIMAVCLCAIVLSGQAKNLKSLPLALYLAFFAFVAWVSAPVLLSLAHEDLRLLFNGANGANGGPVVPRIHSMQPYAGIDTLIKTGLVACTFVVSFVLACDKRLRAHLLTAFIAIGLLYAIYGLLVYYNALSQPAWLDAYVGHQSTLRSVFPNRNNFATFCNIALLCACCWVVRDYARWRDSSLQDGWFTRTAGYLNRLQFYVFVLAFIVLLAASLQTDSRGGSLSLLFAIAALFVLTLAQNHTWHAAAIGLFAFVCLIVLSVEVSGYRMLERLDLLASVGAEETRRAGWEATVSAVRQHWFWGTGAGSYDGAFEAYRPFGFVGRFGLAHNSYLESALELGLPGLVLLLICFTIPLVLCVGGVSHSANHPYAVLGIVITLLVALHSLVDFSMQIPAVAVFYAAVMGMATSVSAGRGKEASRPSV